MRSATSLLFTFVVLLTVGGAARPIKLSTNERSLGKPSSSMVRYSLVISSDLKHLAFVEKVPSGKRVVVDGKPGKPYPDIPEVQLTEAGRPQEIVFSPDGRHVGFVARERDEFFAVIDGVEGKRFSLISVGKIIFSPDSSRVAYIANRDKKQAVIVDGVEGPPFDFISDSSSLFSSDSRIVSYIGRRGDKCVLVMDSRETMTEDYIGRGYPRSPEGHSVFVIRRGDKWHAVIDGKLGPPCDSIGNHILFSSDGKHSLYRAGIGQYDYIFLDGVQLTEEWSITENTYTFTPDGKVAYVTVSRSGRFVVIDKTRLGPYEWVYGEIAFSNAGGHFGFIAEDGGQRFAVIDRKEGPRFDRIDSDVLFASDGSRNLYKGQRAGKQFLMLDGVAVDDSQVDYLLNPAGKLVSISRASEKTEITIDSVKYSALGKPVGALTFSRDGRHVAYQSSLGKKSFVVAEGKAGRTYDDIDSIHFNESGGHISYSANRNGKWVLVVDGIESGEYDSLMLGGDAIWNSTKQLTFVAIRGGEYFSVQINVQD